MGKVSIETACRPEPMSISRLEQLENLMSLRDSGDITPTEFEAEKRCIFVGSMTPSRVRRLGLLPDKF